MSESIDHSEGMTADAAPEGSGADQLNKETSAIAEDAINSEVQAETQDELRDEVEQAIEDGATEAEIKDMIREYEIKVNGKSRKVKLDLGNEQEIIRQLQLAAAGQGAMQDKAELEKLVNQELLNAKSNPWEFLKNTLGLDPDDLAEQRINQRIEEMKKSPEQVRQEKIERELEEARAKLAEQERISREKEMTFLQEKAAVELDQEIDAALKKDPELPKTRKTVRRIADAMLWALNNGYEDVKVSDVIPSVKEEIRKEFNEFISEMPDEMMESYIGKKNIERMRKKRLAAMKTTPSASVQSTTQTKPKEDEDKKKIAARDFFRSLNRG